MRAPAAPPPLLVSPHGLRPAERAIEVLRHRLAAAPNPGGAVAVPAEALRAVLELVEGGAWDDFDGYRRWAGPWQPAEGPDGR